MHVHSTHSLVFQTSLVAFPFAVVSLVRYFFFCSLSSHSSSVEFSCCFIPVFVLQLLMMVTINDDVRPLHLFPFSRMKCFPLTYTASALSYSSLPLSHKSLPLSHKSLPLSYKSFPLSYNAVLLSYSSLPLSHSSLPSSHKSLLLSYNPHSLELKFQASH